MHVYIAVNRKESAWLLKVRVIPIISTDHTVVQQTSVFLIDFWRRVIIIWVQNCQRIIHYVFFWVPYSCFDLHIGFLILNQPKDESANFANFHLLNTFHLDIGVGQPIDTCGRQHNGGISSTRSLLRIQNTRKVKKNCVSDKSAEYYNMQIVWLVWIIRFEVPLMNLSECMCMY